MSYIQVEIGGKLRGLKFNQMAIVIMAQKADQENYAATANYAMVWGGLKANAYQKEEDLADMQEVDGKQVSVPVKFADVVDWVDNLKGEVLDSIFNVLKETEKYKEMVEANQKEVVTDKKKLKSTTPK